MDPPRADMTASRQSHRGLEGLKARVWDKDLCTLCGACLCLCPYLRAWQGRVAAVHDCDLEQGRCHAVCPRIELPLQELQQALFGQVPGDLALGQVRRIAAARATDPALVGRAQTGGVVTALLCLALEKGLISAAICVRRDEQQMPSPFVARTAEQILACAGSSFVACPSLQALGDAALGPEERIGVVGLPCQVQALARMRLSHELENKGPAERVSLVVGLFCTWALSHQPFRQFLSQRFAGCRVQKLDISPPPGQELLALTDRGPKTVPLDQVRPLVRPGCRVCLDLTAELCDLSVGSVEGQPGWSTLVVRSEKGQALVERALGDGLLEVCPLPGTNLAHLREAALAKKQRALHALEQESGLVQSYLVCSPEWISAVLRGAGADKR